MSRRKVAIALLFGLACVAHARAEVILQYFNTSWNEIATRMPELAEAGYTALWLPPPFQAGSQNSVGYDIFDRFNYGSGGIVTRYGSADDVLNLVLTAHRFGIRVYFDNVMAHNGGSIPDTAVSTLSTTQPYFVPEDFHLIQQTNGTYATPPNSIDYNGNEWQVLNRSDFGLDIAQEDPNTSFGPQEGDTFPKFHGIRQPTHPEFYPDTNITAAINGFGHAVHPFTGAGQPVSEDVNAMLIRATRWFLDQTKCDGFRLDDVKGVPSYFFGDQSATNKDVDNAGYCGGIQEQFNITHGYSDWNNHRDSLFNDQLPRDDAMVFGEDLGQPNPCTFTCQQGYVDAGMRVDDNEFYSQMFQAVCGGCNGLWGLDQPGAYSFGGVGTSLIHVGTHDYNDISLFDRTSAHATLLTRAGLPSVYTDGYNSETNVQSDGKYFPAIGNNAFLGQFGDNHLPNLLYINQLFARGNQIPKWSDQTYLAYERQDKRENTGMSDADGTVLLFMMAQNGSGGASRSYTTTFPVGARLVNYSTFNNAQGFGATVATNGILRDDSNNLIVAPAGGYWAFSWRNPEMPAVWDDGMFGQVTPITILQNGQQVGTVSYTRKDGRNGDPNFNPYGIPNQPTNDYQYTMTVPLVTNPSNLTFLAHTDGSCANILMELDGGIDINSQMGLGPQTGGKRDNAPGVATDVYLGYEQMAFVQRVAEKFAARDISRNIIGSPGCETYQATIGTSGFIVNNGSGANTSVSTVTWVYHDPAANNQLGSPTLQFFPAPQSAANQPITVWVKIGYTNQPQHAVLYYTTSSTTNGMPFPEGSAGLGKGTTQVATLAFDSNGPADGAGTPVWWKTTLPAMPSGTVIRYKAGVCRTDAGPWFPFAASDIALKKRMESIYQITNFNAQTVFFYPHNDYGVTQTGLDQGFHVLRIKTFLQRTGRSSIYNLNAQTFYYDTTTPQGEILFPGSNETIVSSNYTVVVRADRTVTETWYRITDSNGTGVWTRATPISPATPGLNTIYPLEWRFNYINIPTNGTAQIDVRLRKLTSSTDMSITNDVAGHFTTLSRTAPISQVLDHVGDGIPDSWRAQYFPNQPTNNVNGTTTNNQSCATCDPDRDGFNNLQEFLAGTDPTNSAAGLRIISITRQPNGDSTVVWTSASGKNYQVYATTDPTVAYAPVGSTVPSAGTNTSYTDPGVTDATKYYKVKIVP
jgi:Alpha amylase, catalytic domain